MLLIQQFFSHIIGSPSLFEHVASLTLLMAEQDVWDALGQAWPLSSPGHQDGRWWGTSSLAAGPQDASVQDMWGSSRAGVGGGWMAGTECTRPSVWQRQRHGEAYDLSHVVPPLPALTPLMAVAPAC